jgi:hypothetical protein
MLRHKKRKQPTSVVSLSSGEQDRTADLRVMNPTLYPSALPRRNRLSLKKVCKYRINSFPLEKMFQYYLASA